VLKQFRELFRVSQQHFQRVERSCGVSGAQLWALAELCERPGQTVSELALALSVHLSTASNLTVRLEKRGLVRRRRSASDQRAVCLYATARGTRCVARAPQPAVGIIPDALHRMSKRSLATLNRDLEALLELTRARDPEAAFALLSE
jgi:DNA-binding MarR family transcriptional regulator